MGNDDQDPPHSRPATGEAARDEQGRFLPGATGNPAGRPSTKWIRDFLAEVTKPGGQPRKMALIQAMFLTSIDRRHKDHVKAGTLLLAYEAGMPIQAVEVTGGDGAPLTGPDISSWTSEQQAARYASLLAKASAEVAAAAAAKDGEEEP
jgi:hypothetical protein